MFNSPLTVVEASKVTIITNLQCNNDLLILFFPYYLFMMMDHIKTSSFLTEKKKDYIKTSGGRGVAKGVGTWLGSTLPCLAGVNLNVARLTFILWQNHRMNLNLHTLLRKGFVVAVE